MSTKVAIPPMWDYRALLCPVMLKWWSVQQGILAPKEVARWSCLYLFGFRVACWRTA